MRLVISTELSSEQENILNLAPLTENILIYGPPGSGKTVMAYLRAETLTSKFDLVSLVMYNKVLSSFSKNAIKEDSIEVKTMHSWVWKWWKGIIKNEELPMSEVYNHDWKKIFELLLENKDDINMKNVDWNHLILDEGQDFSIDMYKYLETIRKIYCKKETSLTVLADENQRLNENNSTIDEIISYIKVEESNVYPLTKNYRNTDEVNRLLKSFYTGLVTGETISSGRKGDKPKFVTAKNFSKSIQFIIRYIKLHQNQEIAIITSSNRHRTCYFNYLSKVFEDESENFFVQTYASDDPKWKSTTKLKFDTPGVITIINKQSCKGLEFDAVFITDLEYIDISSDKIDLFKMEMYVICSRARENLFLMAQNSSDEKLQIMNYLPCEEEKVMEYIDV